MFPIRDHNPAGITPYVTWALIAVNIIVFLVTLGSDTQSVNQLYYDYALFPARVTAGEAPMSMVTSMFMHAGFLHLAGNMLFLHVFGDNLEEQMGPVRYLLFYLACGVAAALAQIAGEPNSTIPMVGASGAIAGVMGGYLLMFPKARVDILLILIVFFKIFPVPAWIVLGLWFAMQLIGSINMPADMGGVAYLAHAGGFVAGIAFVWPLWYRRGGRMFWRRTHGIPPHPPARDFTRRTTVPRVRR